MSGVDRPLVAVLLGTDVHRFDRLVGWVDQLARLGEWDWFVQHGTTSLPAGLPGAPMLTDAELQDLLGRADAVVTHGGPGLIMESRSHRHVPVVVARDPRHNEHVDGHQQRFVGRVASAGLVREARSAEELRALVEISLITDVTDSGSFASGLAERVGALVDALVPVSRRDAEAAS